MEEKVQISLIYLWDWRQRRFFLQFRLALKQPPSICGGMCEVEFICAHNAWTKKAEII